MHYKRWWKHGDPRGGRPRRPNGQGTNSNGYRVRWVNGKNVLEHRLVMAEVIGRELLPNENVHHKNGIRHDNRPENLELWPTSQPKGQRVTDLVAHAREVLELYGELVP
jgi:hypothetical protein